MMTRPPKLMVVVVLLCFLSASLMCAAFTFFSAQKAPSLKRSRDSRRRDWREGFFALNKKMAAWQCNVKKLLSSINYRKPLYAFPGPEGPIPFVSGVNDECDLLDCCSGNGSACEALQDGAWHSPDRWLAEAIAIFFRGSCDRRTSPCLSFDFGSNIGLVTLVMLNQGSHVIAVEPQLDLCCAGQSAADSLHPGAAMFLCGGVSIEQSPGLLLNVSDGYRSTKSSDKFDMEQLYKSLGIPFPTRVPLYPLQHIVEPSVQLSPDYTAKFLKVDTDSVDCEVVRDVLDGPLNFESIAFETWNGLCMHKTGFASLLADIQSDGYDLYHVPATAWQYDSSYQYTYPEILETPVRLANSTIWKLKRQNYTEWVDTQRGQLEFQMLATKFRFSHL